MLKEEQASIQMVQRHLDHLQQTNPTYSIPAYAKINLTLEVQGKRADDYHELVTLMQTIDLADSISLTLQEEQKVRVVCHQPELATASNLAARAVVAVCQRLQIKHGLLIELQKRIPLSAGMGGGSSNAAAVLQALYRWWRLPFMQADLETIAASLGSDVPFFLTGGLALGLGRGEQIIHFKSNWPVSMQWILLLKPNVTFSTASIYHALQAADYTIRNNSQTIVDALQACQPLNPAYLVNSLAHPLLRDHPEVAHAREAMLCAGAPLVCVTGSGPTLFAPFARLDAAESVYNALEHRGYEVYLTRPIDPSGEPVHYYQI